MRRPKSSHRRRPLIDIAQFCSVLDAEKPAGSGVEYDPDFIALENAQKGKAERQYGDTLIPAEPPDWKTVLEQATAIGCRTRDLRIACTLTRALTNLHGLDGLVGGLQLIDSLCSDLWDHVFPQLDETEDNDPTLRMNALAPLADRDALLADIRDCVFVSARGMGPCTVRQLEVALGILAPVRNDTGRPPGVSEIDAIVIAARAQGGLPENRAQRAIDLARTLQNRLADLVGIERAPDLQPLLARLRPVAEYLKKFVAAQSERRAEPAPPESEAAPMPATTMSHQLGSIRSSEDAARMLDLICDYFEKNEPTNPAPLLLRRAQRLSTMNFFEIVRDIAPDAVPSVELVAGTRSET